jgi:hypothetical protein
LLLVGAAVVALRPGAGDATSGPADARPAPEGVVPTRRGDAALDRRQPAHALPAPTLSAPVPSAATLPSGVADADQATVDRLAARLGRHAPLGPEDVQAAEALYARYATPARDLLEAVLLGVADQERQRRRHAEATAFLRRATAVAPSSPRPKKALAAVLLESGDWPGAEAAARELLALAPTDAEAVRSLAYALVRQDRSREAVEVLVAFLDAHPDTETRALLDRIRRDLAGESGLEEQRLAHFHVRYDGEAHEDVGREVLRVLDRHYATLVRTFDHQPSATIPVILMTTRSYYDSTGAPSWSGGQYDTFDGRVRIPIGGLTTALSPDLDGTLLHELTHAFVTDRSRGVAPREIQEGLAQLMEGKRAETLLGDEGLAALANGRIGGPGGFYVASLAFVEGLVAQRGQGGINDLLQTMADTGNADEAFRRVYGKDLSGLKAEWAARLRQRHGG